MLSFALTRDSLLLFLPVAALLCALATGATSANTPPAALTVGQPAPAFTVPDQNNHDVTLADLRGQWVVLYFYPKADTPGCTKEACDLSNNFAGFEKMHAHILGCSADTVAAQKKFAEKYHLKITLLADPQHQVLEPYRAWREGRIVRSTVLIDPQGRIAYHWPNVSPTGHADMVQKKLAELQAAGTPK